MGNPRGQLTHVGTGNPRGQLNHVGNLHGLGLGLGIETSARQKSLTENYEKITEASHRGPLSGS